MGWQNGQVLAAAACLAMVAAVAGWRVGLNMRYGQRVTMTPRQVRAVVRQLELNALLAGLMWAVAVAPCSMG
jgi:hypothetical protein